MYTKKKLVPPLYVNSRIYPSCRTPYRLDNVAKKQRFLDSRAGCWPGKWNFYIIEVSEFEAYAYKMLLSAHAIVDRKGQE